MDGPAPVGGAGTTPQPSNGNAGQSAADAAAQKAAFDQAIFDIGAAELLTDHFVVTQPILDDINKESSK
jgi:hypothetical protein